MVRGSSSLPGRTARNPVGKRGFAFLGPPAPRFRPSPVATWRCSGVLDEPSQPGALILRDYRRQWEDRSDARTERCALRSESEQTVLAVREMRACLLAR